MRFCQSSTSGNGSGPERLEYEKGEQRISITVSSRLEKLSISIKDRSGARLHLVGFDLGPLLREPKKKTRRRRS